ncbi:hypothetical protein BV898_01964 [Hypsibius exemplaris]|uniref:Uncharacterized protein n=1 Tax=Hypsibius exemplaris TaxID=2072580 RepID=A0A1W0X8Y5_HYPEX|nr:hypothetical protein BV898_01964 [Hypsibius exemplaris]
MAIYSLVAIVMVALFISVIDGAPNQKVSKPVAVPAERAAMDAALKKEIYDVARQIKQVRAKHTRTEKQMRDGFGSFEGGPPPGGGGPDLLTLLGKLQGLMALLDLLNPTTTTTAKPDAGAKPDASKPAAAAAPAPAPGLTLPQLLGIIGLLGDDANELASGHSGLNCGACDSHTEIESLIPLPDHILALSAKDAFKLEPDGTLKDTLGEPKYQAFQKLNGTPTASLRINENYYVFFGSEVALLDLKTKLPLRQMPIRELFFGVKEPVRGAFRFNEHTLVLLLDRHFVFYQPLANPPIDPRFSPQPLTVIPNGPDKIDGALEINGTNYLYGQGWLYQIAEDEMVIVDKIPLRQFGLGDGWMKCTVHKQCK